MKCERCDSNDHVIETYSPEDDKEMDLCIVCRYVEFYSAVLPYDQVDYAPLIGMEEDGNINT